MKYPGIEIDNKEITSKHKEAKLYKRSVKWHT